MAHVSQRQHLPGITLLYSIFLREGFCLAAGMHGFVDVRKCNGFEPTRRRMTIEERRQSREWTYYIAAEEIVWDYAPKEVEHIDE